MASQGVPSQTAQIQKEVESKSNSASASFADLGIENTDIKTASGVELSSQQKVLVGSVLDVCPALARLLPIRLYQPIKP